MNCDCSIVIRAYNEENHIGRLLDGIARQTIKALQVIVVDSGSTDRTAVIARANGAEVVSIAPQDFTFGRSLNLGITSAKTQFILIASAHVYPVYPDWMERMLAPFCDSGIGLVYGKQRGAEQSQFSEQQIFTHWYGNNSLIPQSHPFCNNANAAIRKSLWEQHLYDENLPGLEDLEWAKWVMEQKYKIAYCSEAEVIHVHSESWRGIRNRYLREGMAFKQIYPHEQFSRLDQLRLFLQNSISDMRQAFLQHVFIKQCLNIVRFRWLQFLGTYQGYQRSGPLTWQLRQSFYYPRNHTHPKQQLLSRSVAPIEYSD